MTSTLCEREERESRAREAHPALPLPIKLSVTVIPNVVRNLSFKKRIKMRPQHSRPARRTPDSFGAGGHGFYILIPTTQISSTCSFFPFQSSMILMSAALCLSMGSCRMESNASLNLLVINFLFVFSPN